MSPSRKRTDTRPLIIVDWDKCIRIERGDEPWARKTTPYTCLPCLTSGSMSAKLRFDGSPIPLCEDHDPPLQMEAVTRG